MINYEVSAADDEITLTILDGDDLLDLGVYSEDPPLPGEYALVIGDPASKAYAVTGSLAELEEFGLRVWSFARSLRISATPDL